MPNVRKLVATVTAFAFALAVSAPSFAADADENAGWAKIYFKIPLSGVRGSNAEEPGLGFAAGFGPSRSMVGVPGVGGLPMAYRDDVGRTRWGGARIDLSFTSERFNSLMLNGVQIVDTSGRLSMALPGWKTPSEKRAKKVEKKDKKGKSGKKEAKGKSGKKQFKWEAGWPIFIGFGAILVGAGYLIYMGIESNGNGDRNADGRIIPNGFPNN